MTLLFLLALAYAQDLDGDGIPDATDSCPSVPNPTQSLEVGGARLMPTLDRGSAGALKTGDLNGDGLTDLVASINAGIYDNGFAVYFQQEDASYTAQMNDYGGDFAPVQISLGDLDGDGDLDLLSGTVTYFNQGDGTMLRGHNFWIGNNFYAYTTVLIDLDADGDLDIFYGGNAYEYIAYEYIDYVDYYYVENLGGGVFAQEVLSSHTESWGYPYLDVADVDGDGDSDLLMADRNTGEASWFENTGGFSLVDHPLTHGADNPTNIHAADLDGDGDQDLALVSCQEDRVLWLQHEGADFNEKVLTTTLYCPQALALADVDQDGDHDLVVGAMYGTYWIENLGGGNFTGPELLDATRNISVVVADLDHTGTPDIAFGTVQGDPWLLPTLQPANTDAAGVCDADDLCPLDPTEPCVDADGDRLSDTDEASFGSSPSQADSDGDGLDDYAEWVAGTLPLQPDTDGDGLLDGVDPCPLGDDPDQDGVCGLFDHCPLAADPLQEDLDADGVGDVCDDCPTVFDPAQGQGYAGGQVLGSGRFSHAVDLDGDGVLDLAMARRDRLLWAQGLGAGQFGPEQVLGRGAHELVVVDLDADGDLDLLLTSWEKSVSWVENLGAGSFLPAQQLFASDEVGTAHAADLDGDGLPELLVAEANTVYRLDNFGAGSFSAPVVLNTTELGETEGWLHTVDLDADGDLDLITGGSYAEEVRLYINQAGALAAPITLISLSEAGSIDTADLDGDGDLDLLIGRPFVDQVVWVPQLAALTFGAEIRIMSNLRGAGSAIAVDLDGDGDVDTAFVGRFEDEMWVGLNDGSGAFELTEVAKNTGLQANQVMAVDLDVDGGIDLFASGADTRWFAKLGLPDLDRDGLCDVDDLDVDGDGVQPPQDCDDGDASVYPGAPDLTVDGVDQDCDGVDGTGPHTGHTGLDTALLQETGLPLDTALPLDTGSLTEAPQPQESEGYRCQSAGGGATLWLLALPLMALRRRGSKP